MYKKKRSDRKNDEAGALMQELQNYEREGTRLYLDNCPSQAEEIVQACMISESVGYMRDIISEDGKHISEIRFIKIT